MRQKKQSKGSKDFNFLFYATFVIKRKKVLVLVFFFLRQLSPHLQLLREDDSVSPTELGHRTHACAPYHSQTAGTAGSEVREVITRREGILVLRVPQKKNTVTENSSAR